MSDIVDRLRSWVYTDSLYATAQEAAGEIERLRSRLRFVDAVIRSGDVAALTDAERGAVEAAIDILACNDGVLDDCSSIAATMRGLLERLK